MQIDKYKIPVSMVTPTLDPERFGFEDTSEVEPLTETISQELSKVHRLFAVDPAGQFRFPLNVDDPSVAQQLQDMPQAVAKWGEIEIKPGGRVITET